ncbi:hypothetical protein [Filomicrobium insigne]|uniref:hypothetical protein n=1 Tax=Filomicrobium insigne TaxID=418854 RepID=UPI001AEC9BC2|nr:hypothetical protein [Filomicrobium insigne]
MTSLEGSTIVRYLVYQMPEVCWVHLPMVMVAAGDIERPNDGAATLLKANVMAFVLRHFATTSVSGGQGSMTASETFSGRRPGILWL